MHVTAVVGLGARRPERPERLDADLKLIKSLAVAGKVQTVRLMLPQPPPGAEPQKARPSLSASRVATVLAMMPGSRNVTGDTSVPNRRFGVETGEQAEGEPRLGYRLPGTVHLRNLDQVVHQRDATKPICIGRQRHIPKPANRILSPRKPRDLQHDSRSCGRAMIMIGSGLLIDLGGGAVLLNDQDLVPALILGRLEEPADLAQLIGEHRCRDRPVARSVALPAQRGSVHDHQHCRKSGLAGEMPVGCPPLLIQPEGVDHRGQRALAPRGNDLIEQRRRPHASRSAGPLPTAARSASELTTSAVRNRSAAQVDFPERRPGQHHHGGSGSRASVIRRSLAACSARMICEPPVAVERAGRKNDSMSDPKPVESWLTDMDGVLVHEELALPGASEFIAALQEHGRRFLVLTNNSIYTPRDLRARLLLSGIDVPEECIWTSALATAQFLADQRAGGTAYVLGDVGLTSALHDVGFVLTERRPDYVVLGETKTHSFENITRAIRLIERGARFIATNPDPTGPSRKDPYQRAGPSLR